MRRTVLNGRFARAIACCLVFVAASKLQADTPLWQRLKVDDAFRSEGVAAADVNKDGKMDVLAGDVWYEAPNWLIHEIRKPRASGLSHIVNETEGATGSYNGEKGYSNSFANFAHDLNGDGWQDLICIGFPGEACHWYENPQNRTGHWKQREIWHSACGESPAFVDVTGDGKPELILASQPEGQMGYLEIPPADKLDGKWTFVAVSKKATGTERYYERYYHGLGVGDLNNDGRTDIVIPHGWWAGPEKLGTGPWEFHPLTLSKDNKGDSLKAANMYVDDLDLDGDNEILMSSAHERGVWWFDNVGTNAEPKYEYHLIDEHFTQTHALHYADINGDGVKDLITGKRYYAHGPKGDPDPQGEVVMFWYEVQKMKGAPPKFIPHKIEEGIGTGVGTQFLVTDFDGDKLLDIVLSNKKGTNVLVQKRAVIGK